MALIAEYKPRSPFGWQGPPIELEDFIQRYENEADLFSIHVTEPWGGSWGLIERARCVTDKPLLAKGILTANDVRIAWWKYVIPLLIEGRNAELAEPGGVIEVGNEAQLVRALEREPLWIVVNARDLETGRLYRGRHKRLCPLIPRSVVRVAASGLYHPRPDYHLSLIGQSLMEAMRG